MDMNKVELNDMMQEQIAGGEFHLPRPKDYGKLKLDAPIIHDGCGGVIDNPLFGYAVCQKCGETHWFLSSFKFHHNDQW